ncbi:MAG: alpha/beta hydrolase [Thiohalocapsa sp.]
MTSLIEQPFLDTASDADLRAGRVSLAAELVRLGLRLMLKQRRGRRPTIAEHRAVATRFEAWVPRAPTRAVTIPAILGAVSAVRVAMPQSEPGRHVLFLHGGGYVTGSPTLYRHVSWRIAEATRAQVWLADYRLAPEHPFPAALDDAVAAWHGLLSLGADPRQVTVIGDSAGGGLALALALRLRDEGQELPAALVALSPWTDLALSGDSLRRNAAADPMLCAAIAGDFAACYLAGADPRNPYVSPLYGDPAGLPPTLIQVGSDEVLRDDAVRMAARMRAAGCPVELEMWPRMPHVWHAFAAVMPEARQAIARIGSFVERHATAALEAAQLKAA